MACTVVDVHRDKDPERLDELLTVYFGLEAELDQHMAKEERILFPIIRQGQGAMAGGPVSVMRREHDSAATALRRLRELTNGYEVPPEACNTWRAVQAVPDVLKLRDAGRAPQPARSSPGGCVTIHLATGY